MTPDQKRQYWTDLIADYQNGDLSQAQFCQINGLSIGVFKYWLYQKLPSVSSDLTLIPVKLATNSAASSLGPVSLEISKQFMLHFSPEADPQSLKSFLIDFVTEFTC